MQKTYGIFHMLGGGDNFRFFFGLLRGKNKNVLELPKNQFKNIRKVADFPNIFHYIIILYNIIMIYTVGADCFCT